jgi:SAM-dependent methyltransferase
MVETFTSRKYFENFRYSRRKKPIQKHFLEVLKWGSTVSNTNLLNGQNKKALDVGSAYGYAVDVLASLDYDAYGIDISKYAVDQAKMRYANDFVICDVQTGLPFRTDVFDLITCFEVLEHLPKSLQAIKMLASHCKHIMIYTTPNRITEKPIRKLVRDYDDSHVAVRTPGEWKKCLNKTLESHVVHVDSYLDVGLNIANNLLLFKSFKIPYFGLNVRIIIWK